MQVSNNSNQSFNGAFRLTPSQIKAKAEIPNLISHGKLIFQDVMEKGDQVIITRNNYDKKITKYMQKENIQDIEYYPEINTKMGLDNEKPEGLLELLKDKSIKVIRDLREVKDASIEANPKITKKSSSIVEYVADALRLNIENAKIISTRSFTTIRDAEKKRTIEIVMPNEANSLIHVKPDKAMAASTKCEIDKEGNIRFFETPDEIFEFLCEFKKLKKKYINLIAKE